MSNCLELGPLPEDNPSEIAMMAKKSFLLLLGLVVMGYLGFSFGKLFPTFPEATTLGCITGIIFGIIVRSVEQSMPQPVYIQCVFCEAWKDIKTTKSYPHLKGVVCDECSKCAE